MQIMACFQAKQRSQSPPESFKACYVLVSWHLSRPDCIRTGVPGLHLTLLTRANRYPLRSKTFPKPSTTRRANYGEESSDPSHRDAEASGGSDRRGSGTVEEAG